uniref:Peroxisomal ATPase PEX1 n=3 Tax=Cacopsylla melanoneura TaxID=428564 RepID=A0A8D8QJS5_9HEMI
MNMHELFIHVKRITGIIFARLWALLFVNKTIMKSYEAEVAFIKKFNCFVYVNEVLMKALKQRVKSENIHGKFHIVKNKKSFYATIKSNNDSNKREDVVYLNKKYANILGVKEKDKLHITTISPETSGEFLQKVYFHTSHEDYDKISSCIDKLETVIQKQVRCVGKNSRIPIWITERISVIFSIQTLEPEVDFGLLKDNTELHYEPSDIIEKSDDNNNMFEGLVRDYFHSKQRSSVPGFAAQPKYARICSLDSLKLNIPEQFQMIKHASCVYVRKEFESDQFKKNKGVFSFHQINFKNDAETDAGFCSHIYELDEIERELYLENSRQENKSKHAEGNGNTTKCYNESGSASDSGPFDNKSTDTTDAVITNTECETNSKDENVSTKMNESHSNGDESMSIDGSITNTSITSIIHEPKMKTDDYLPTSMNESDGSNMSIEENLHTTIHEPYSKLEETKSFDVRKSTDTYEKHFKGKNKSLNENVENIIQKVLAEEDENIPSSAQETVANVDESTSTTIHNTDSKNEEEEKDKSSHENIPTTIQETEAKKDESTSTDSKDGKKEKVKSSHENISTAAHESDSNKGLDDITHPRTQNYETNSEVHDDSQCSVEIMKSKDETNPKTEENKTENESYSKASTPDTDDSDVEFSSVYEPLLLVYMDRQLLKELNLSVGTKFTISNYKENYQCQKVILHVRAAEMRSKNLKPKDIDDEFLRHNRVHSSSPRKQLILNQNSILKLKIQSESIPVRIELVPSTVKYCLFHGKIKHQVVMGDEQNDSGNRRPVELDYTNYTPVSTENLFLDHLNDTLSSILTQIRTSLTSYHIYKDNILVIGPEGCGKTTLCRALQEQLYNDYGPDSISCQVIDCKTMKNKISNVIEKTLRDILSKASYMEPACLILDDIDVLCSINKETLDANATVHSNKVCSLFVSLIHEFQHNSNLIILGVTSSKDIIKSTRAGLLFSHCFTLPSLDLNCRSLLLENLIQSKLNTKYFDSNSIDLNKLSKLCEGYSIQDMCDIVDKALFHYLHNTVDPIDLKDPGSQESTQPFSNQDLEMAFHSHVPLALKGINTDIVEKITFHNVGGLKSAKQLLIETLVWPSMYPALFSQCPLKPQSGILLYGAPGTGKTLLASAISGECGLKFISIKGPELFSKFIGESEEGVRNIFNRARSIKPCILFFDEFDSLAAKRGNDSTGVKDRVVNQLLTELDGVEGLDGVYVVGATSRPDIIDPALLRPGRLGASVNCTMPDLKEREEILSVLIQKTKRNDDLDLTEIARRTERFTGADLWGVLCSAQMIRQDKEESEEDPEITQADLLEALEDTKPSLSPLDSLKYEKIYDDFANSKGLSSEDMKKQKVISA